MEKGKLLHLHALKQAAINAVSDYNYFVRLYDKESKEIKFQETTGLKLTEVLMEKI